MLDPAPDFDALRARFRWNIPARYNIAESCCFAWARREPGRVALILRGADDSLSAVTYGEMARGAARLAHALRDLGVGRGDRVAVILPQGRETAMLHVAVHALGAVSLPLAALFGVDAIEYRLRDAGAKVVLTNAAGVAKLRAVEGLLPDLVAVVSTDGADRSVLGLDALVDGRPEAIDLADTGPDDPAMMIYTSGTTGPPKGALHGHRVLLGHLPGVQTHHEFLPRDGDRLWTPADWAWAGGLLNVLLPGLHFGVPVVAGRFERFDPEAAYRLMAEAGVRNTFIPPTALKMLRAAPPPRGRHELRLRTIGSGGESLGAETLAWGREAFGLTINEFYGQTECNLVLSSIAALGVTKPGFIGKAVPGHEVAVIRADGSACAPMEEGQIAVRRPDPVMFLGYWGKPEATAAKFVGDWMTTGDQGLMDAEGYVHFHGRDDDVITSAGYRIGPGEIEDCLIKHEAVSLAAAVGKPDALRTEIVKAFVVLKPGHAPSDALAEDIRLFVRSRLSAHEYPREIAFIDELPMTTTGKVMRRLLRDRG
jgi:acetyl-CoA synthetase